MSTLRDRLDALRAGAHRTLDKLPGKLGEVARRTNAALGRPLADAAELADRRAFEARTEAPAAAPASTSAPRSAAPVIVYHTDKTSRDAARLTEVLDGAGVSYKVMNIQDDPAAQAAVRRDSKGFRLPVVFIAGEAIGGRAELTNLAASGDLKRKVFG